MAVSIFFCYAHEDEALLNMLKMHLWPLQREGLIAVWHDRDISAGAAWEQEISHHLNTAQIILLLVSPEEFRTILDVLEDLASEADTFDSRFTHPWRGFNGSDSSLIAQQNLEADLQRVGGAATRDSGRRRHSHAHLQRHAGSRSS